MFALCMHCVDSNLPLEILDSFGAKNEASSAPQSHLFRLLYFLFFCPFPVLAEIQICRPDACYPASPSGERQPKLLSILHIQLANGSPTCYDLRHQHDNGCAASVIDRMHVRTSHTCSCCTSPAPELSRVIAYIGSIALDISDGSERPL